MATDIDPLDWPYAAFPAGYSDAIQRLVKEAKEYRMAADAEAEAGDDARREASALRMLAYEAWQVLSQRPGGLYEAGLVARLDAAAWAHTRPSERQRS